MRNEWLQDLIDDFVIRYSDNYQVGTLRLRGCTLFSGDVRIAAWNRKYTLMTLVPFSSLKTRTQQKHYRLLIATLKSGLVNSMDVDPVVWGTEKEGI